MKKRLINIFICCTISICGAAQTEGYKYYAALDSVKTAGFYKIILSPEINAHLKTDYSDVRIVNADNKWVPHILHAAFQEYGDISIKEELKFAIEENNKSNTNILISYNKTAINNIGLIIKNTAAERYCKLSGSDDNIKWFVINDSILIDPSTDDENTETGFRIDFPNSNYANYKVEIINNNKDPFNIKQIVHYTSGVKISKIKLNEIQNPVGKLLQKDSGKVSYIRVTQEQSFHFDMLNLKVKGSKYFSRKLDLYIPENDNNSFSNMGSFVNSFNISNNSNLHFNFSIQASKVFYLKIYNEDNLPLIVLDVATSINERYLATYLEKGQDYKLVLENKIASKPNYDLQKTFPSIKDTLPALTLKEIMPFKENNITVLATKNNKWIIWAALVAGLFILLLLTKKMIKEVDKKEI
jgi:hypothetical protein